MQHQQGEDVSVVDVEPILVLPPSPSPSPEAAAAEEEEKEKAAGILKRLRRAVAGTWRAFKGLFVSAETEDACRQVWRLLVRFTRDVAPGDLAAGVLLISSHHHRYPPPPPPRARRLCAGRAPDAAFAEEAAALMRHASGSYGWKLLCGFMTHALEARSIPVSTVSPMLAMGDDDANLAAMLKHTRVDPGDVLDVRWKSETFSPGHYVAVDRSLDAVVVSVRGTWGLHDSVADLLAESAPFEFGGVAGHVHRGVLRCAERKAELLDALLALHVPEHRALYVTGHSLGGGVATLLALLLAKRHPDWNIVCFAFAPAAPMTRELADSPAVMAIVRSVIFRDDLIPRLSFGSLEMLKRTIQHVLVQSPTTPQRVFQWIAAGNMLGNSITQRMERRLGVRAEIDLEKAVAAAKQLRGEEHTFMFPGGRVFFLTTMPSAEMPPPSPPAPPAPPPPADQPAAAGEEEVTVTTVEEPSSPDPEPVVAAAAATAPSSADKKQAAAATTKFVAATHKYALEEVAADERDYFSEIVVSSAMFTDHLPHKYEIAINRAADDITGVVHNIDPIELHAPSRTSGDIELQTLSPPTEHASNSDVENDDDCSSALDSAAVLSL